MKSNPDTRSNSRRSSTTSVSSYSNTPTQTKCYCRFVGLEPVLFIQNVVSQLVYVTSQDLMVEKTCKVNHNLNYDTCDNLSDYDATDEIIHDEVSEFLMWRDILEASIKFVVILFIGPWSDKYGRRFPLILCLILLMGESLIMLINSQQETWPLEMMLLCSVPYGLSGGHYALLMLSFSYVAHTSSTRKRTFRMGFLDTFWYFGKTIGLALKPVIKDNTGYVGVFVTAIFLYLGAAVYVLVKLRNEIIPGSNDEEEECCCQQCSLDHINDGVISISKKRPNNDRMHIIILVCAMMLDAFAAQGEGSVRYLFVLRAVDWSSSRYSYWYSLTSLLSVIGGFIIVPSLTLLYPLSDPLIGVVGAGSRLLANLAYAPVNKPGEDWLLYLGAILGSFAILAPVSIRSLLSKISKEEIGSIFGAMAAGETLILFLSAPIYTSIYNATNTNHPGAYNYFSAVVHTSMIAGFCYILHSMKKHGRIFL